MMQNQETIILVVDDEAAVRKLLRRCFEAENYIVLEASTSEEMFSLLTTNDVSLITLDISLGSENGLDLAKQIRKDSNVGIIIVSGKGDLIDTVLGLEIGADDYISKPFELREVVARARSVLRRTKLSTTNSSQDSPKSTATGFQFGNWRLYPSKRLVLSTDNIELELTSAEFDLLAILIAQSHNVLSRSQIMDAMKGQAWNPNDRTIDNHIAKLRKKLDPENTTNIVKSVRGVGYVFTMDVLKL
ncbi:MAG: response regulator transcription factor [Granulosicoccaceae bacterium]